MPKVETLEWIGSVDGSLMLIDQTCLPVDLVIYECVDVDMVWEAIKSLRVRGAPAIGIAAAYGICLGLNAVGDDDEEAFFARLEKGRQLPREQSSYGCQSVLGDRANAKSCFRAP